MSDDEQETRNDLTIFLQPAAFYMKQRVAAASVEYYKRCSCIISLAEMSF